MPIRREFLGWDGACLEKAACYFVEKYLSDSQYLDLQDIVIFLPGSRAERRLLTLLTILAEEKNVTLIPPHIMTAGSFISFFYNIKEKQASQIETLLAWVQALTEFDKEELKTVIPFPPQSDHLLDWFVLAERQNKIFSELSASKLTYQDVINKLENYDGYNDDARWNVLAKIHDDYKKILKAQGLVDRSILQEHYTDLELNKNLEIKEIYLLATADLNEVIKTLIKEIPYQVTALIHAPETHSQGFDELGCIINSYWEKVQININDSQITVANKPDDQAELAVKLLEGVQDSDATVGIINPEVEPYLLRSMESAHKKARSASGISMAVARPVTLLESCKSFLQNRTFVNMASLVRHIDMQSYIIKKLNLSVKTITASLDEYQCNHLQDLVIGKLPDPKDDNYSTVSKLKKFLEELLSPFINEKASFSVWRDRICEFLLKIYALDNGKDVKLDPSKRDDMIIIQTCSKLRNLLAECCEIPVNLLNLITAEQALELIVHLLSKETIPVEGANEGVEVLGWLEVHLDDAPFLILTGFNEGFIPESLNADALLPNSLRNILGLTDNAHRYARDAYEFSAVLASRNVHVIVGKSSAEDELYMVSRLLFATDKLTLAKRVNKFYDKNVFSLKDFNDESSDKDCKNNSEDKWLPSTPDELQKFLKGNELEQKTKFSASSLNDYLKCPYRYFLKHVLHLNAYSDDIDELSGSSVGSIFHRILKNFSNSKMVSSSDNQEIEKFLLHELDEYFDNIYGKNVIPVVKLQKLFLIPRLKRFAEIHVQEVEKGWQILPEWCERDLNIKLVVECNKNNLESGETWEDDTQDNNSRCKKVTIYFDTIDIPELSDDEVCVDFTLRLDWLDYNNLSDEWRIIDYKTGKSEKPNSKFNTKQLIWNDLQIPLYIAIIERYLQKDKGQDVKVSFAYLMLPQEEDKAEVAYLGNPYRSKLTVSDLVKYGLTQAGEAILDILDKKFWPPKIVTWEDDFSNLIGDVQYE